MDKKGVEIIEGTVRMDQQIEYITLKKVFNSENRFPKNRNKDCTFRDN